MLRPFTTPALASYSLLINSLLRLLSSFPPTLCDLCVLCGENKQSLDFFYFFKYNQSVKGGYMNKILKVLLVSVLTLGLTCGLYANGLNLNSIGSKASAMGTAGVGLADDFSAVYFNPAGLTQMENANLSVFLTDIVPNASYRFDLLGMTLADTETGTLHFPSGALAYFKPVSDKVVLGIAAYAPSGVGIEWSGIDLALLSGGTAFEWYSFIAMISVSPTIAIKLSDQFSIGASLNLDYAKLVMRRPGGGEGGIPWFQYEEDLNGIGVGATIGVMYKPSRVISWGATVKLPVKASIDGTASIPFLTNIGLPGESRGERSATWPLWLGTGIAIKPNDKLTIIADVHYTNWKKLADIPITFDDPGWKAAGLEHGAEFVLNWEDTVDFKVGIEYWVSDSIALRGGFYTDLSPSPEETLNILLPSISYKAFTFGFGYKGRKMDIDFAVEYLTGDDRTVNPMNYFVGAGMPGVHGMKILAPNITFTYKFGK
jgi:long-chain fatty acid transport protein